MLAHQLSECVILVQATLAEHHPYSKTQWGEVRLFVQIVLLVPTGHGIVLTSVTTLISITGVK